MEDESGGKHPRQGFDPALSESYIIFELDQNRSMEQSLEMASLAQHFLVSHAGRADREVRQAGFLVLWATRMPSVLVELDFMCNPDIERYFQHGQIGLALVQPQGVHAGSFQAFTAAGASCHRIDVDGRT